MASDEETALTMEWSFGLNHRLNGGELCERTW